MPRLGLEQTCYSHSLGSNTEAYNGTPVSEYFSMMLDILTKHKAR